MARQDDNPSYTFPAPHGPWVAELLAAIPRESKATCDDCAMCTKEGPVADRNSFDPNVKCCSYEPRLPNFMVGRILADDTAENAEGRASVELRIERQLDVSPLGLVGSARSGLLYGHHDDYGRAPELRCPHYVETKAGGGCGIWAHRPVVCATWFCKHDRGAVGQEFWSRLSAFLRAVDMDLSIWCAAELGAVSGELFTLESSPSQRLDRAELGGPVDTERHRRIWGDWTGRERSFYEACADLVSEIRWERVSAICGPRVRVLVNLVKEAYAKLLSLDIPVRLKVGTYRVEDVQNRKLRVVTYSGYDPLMMSERLARALPYFSGQPWPEALESIRTNVGVGMDPQLVRRLTDFQILVECKKPD